MDEETIKENISHNIRFMIENADFNQSMISRETDITRPTILSLLNKESHSIRFSTLIKLSKTLGITPEKFMFEKLDMSFFDKKVELTDEEKIKKIFEILGR